MRVLGGPRGPGTCSELLQARRPGMGARLPGTVGLPWVGCSLGQRQPAGLPVSPVGEPTLPSAQGSLADLIGILLRAPFPVGDLSARP